MRLVKGDQPESLESSTRTGHSRVSVSRTLSLRGPRPRRLLQAIPAIDRNKEAEGEGRTPVSVLLSPACLSTPSGDCTRSANFKGSRRVYAPERIGISQFPSSGGRNRTCDKAINSRPPVPTQDPPNVRFVSEVRCRSDTKKGSLSG